MSYWVLLVAPLALASLVMLFAFVGCGLDDDGLGGTPTETYKDVVGNETSLVSYWRLGEDQGTTAVDSEDGNNGEYVLGPTLGVPGLVVGDTDTAAQFDGSTQYVKVPYTDKLNPEAFTVEAIVTVTGGDTQFRSVVSSRDVDADGQVYGYILYASAGNLWEAWVGDATAQWKSVTGPVVTPEKHYVAMTYDGKTLRLYVDPAEDTITPTAVSYQRNTSRELRIGAGKNEADPPDFFFPGVIDEVAIYNAALDFTTIKKHFTLATSGGE